MDFSSQVLHDSSVFSDSNNFINLKLKSPSPHPFNSTTHRNNDYNNNTSTPEPESPTKPTKLEPHSLESSATLIKDEVTAIHLKTISKFDIYKKILSQIAGKDRIAKVLFYLLKLIKHYLITTRRFIVDEKFTNLSLNPIGHYKTPIKYMKLLLFLNSTLFEKKISILVDTLSVFRFAIRFGGTPHRLRNFFLKLNDFLQKPSVDAFQAKFINESFLADLINLYYGITDELFLLFKLNVLTNKPLRKVVGRHIDLAWLYDVLLGLKQNYEALSTNRNKQMQLNIQYQVRQKATQLSKSLIENIGGGNSPLRSQLLKEFNTKTPLSSTSSSYTKELAELKHQEKIIKLDLVRLSCDLVCVSIDVWGLKLHPTVYSWSGLVSGVTGLTKVWITAEKELLE